MDNIYTKMYTDKFKEKNLEEKNLESFKELEDFTLNRKTEIRYMVCAIELGVHITNDELKNDMWLYNNVVMIPNPYQASNKLDIILRDNTVHTIKLSVPCVCGFYSDETHP
jgi:hypothetical protein